MADVTTLSPEMKKLAESPEVKKKLADRARAKTDKLFLATQVLGYDFVQSVHQELFDQYVPFDPTKPWAEQSTIKNRLVLWPRGSFKTTSIIVEIVQAILNFPDIRILIMQGSLKTTKGLLREIAAHFMGDAPRSQLYELFPEFCGDKKELELSAERFTTPARKRKQLQQATVSCASPKSTKTGQHYDVGFFDDLINDQNYRNLTLLKKAEQDFQMCQPLIDPGGYRYVTGTRYAFGDLYETIIRHNLGEWIITVKDCWLADRQTPRFPRCTTKDGRIIGFTKEFLLQIKSDDPVMFASQYLNYPIAEGQQLFTEEMLLEACIGPDKVPALSPIVLFVDLASTDAHYSDDSCIVAGKVDNVGRMYVVDVDGDKWLPSQLAIRVIEMALKHRPVKIMFEKTASCVYFVEYLMLVARSKGINLPIEYIKVDTGNDAKYLRIANLQGHITNKRLSFVVGTRCWDKMVKQFVELSKGNIHHKHNDYPDTIALMAVEFTKNTVATMPFGVRQRNPYVHALGETVDTVLNNEKRSYEDDTRCDFIL